MEAQPQKKIQPETRLKKLQECSKSSIEKPATVTHIQKLSECFADPVKLVKIESHLSLANICKVPYPIIKNIGVDKFEIVTLVGLLIIRFNNLLNTSKPMDKEQMSVLALDLVEAFEYDTIEDVVLFFKMARNLKFGNIYRIDPPIILSWLPQYFEMKAEQREKLHKEQLSKPALDLPQDIKKDLTKMLDKIVKRSIDSIPASKPKPQTIHNNYDLWLVKIKSELPEMSDKQLKELKAKTENNKELQELIQAEMQQRTKI